MMRMRPELLHRRRAWYVLVNVDIHDTSISHGAGPHASRIQSGCFECLPVRAGITEYIILLLLDTPPPDTDMSM